MAGASRRDLLWKITVPLVQPTIVYVLVTSTISALQIFVIPQMLTADGPNYTKIASSFFLTHRFTSSANTQAGSGCLGICMLI